MIINLKMADIESKLQRLQLSDELERALDLEFGYSHHEGMSQ